MKLSDIRSDKITLANYKTILAKIDQAHWDRISDKLLAKILVDKSVQKLLDAGLTKPAKPEPNRELISQLLLRVTAVEQAIKRLNQEQDDLRLKVAISNGIIAKQEHRLDRLESNEAERYRRFTIPREN